MSERPVPRPHYPLARHAPLDLLAEARRLADRGEAWLRAAGWPPAQAARRARALAAAALATPHWLRGEDPWPWLLSRLQAELQATLPLVGRETLYPRPRRCMAPRPAPARWWRRLARRLGGGRRGLAS